MNYPNIGLALSLIAANFIYAYLMDRPYEVAFERSYFQCIAILMAALVSKVPS